MRRSRRVDVYSVLGVDRSISWNDLRRSYRDRARELHPDVQAHRSDSSRLDQSKATALFIQLQAAWAQVSTPERRAEYDKNLLAQTVGQRPNPPRRPREAPPWRVGPRAGVLLRTGPGEMHIAIPGGPWDISLKRFTELVGRRSRALVIGELPFDQPTREALLRLRFCERHRLITMVGVLEDQEERGHGSELDDDGAWKLRQLAAAMGRWAAAYPARSRELPYGFELELMGRLSLLGYQLNLPHPAGLYAAVEGRPQDRLEARRRSEFPQVELSLPPLSLLLAAAWSQDPVLIGCLARGWAGVARMVGENAAPGLRRLLDGRRARIDGFEPLPGSALERSPLSPSLQEGLAPFPGLVHFLATTSRVPRTLPWGEPAALCGEDRSLSDAAMRLNSALVDAILEPPQDSELVWVRGGRARLRLTGDPSRAEELRVVAEARMESLLGFPVQAELESCRQP